MLESQSSKRKKAGFIRTSSTKALPAFDVTQKSESSNSFSSFQYEKQGEEKNTNQNFNYSAKKEKKSKPTSKPPLPAVRLNQQNFETWGSLEEHNTYQAKREESTGSLKRNQKLKTNSSIQKWLAQEKGKQEIEENLAQAKKICHKIHEMRISNSTEKFKNIEKQFSRHFTTENLQNKQTRKISKNQKKFVNDSKPTHHLLKKLPYEFQESSLSKSSEQEEQSFQIQAQFNKERNKSSIRLKQKVGNHQNSLRKKNQSARNKFIFENEEEQNTYIHNHFHIIGIRQGSLEPRFLPSRGLLLSVLNSSKMTLVGISVLDKTGSNGN